MQVSARIISYLLHPLFMPLYSMLLILEGEYSVFQLHPKVKALAYAIILVNTIFIPVVFTLGMKRKGMIHTVEMESSRERRMPYLLYFFMLIVTWFFLKKAKLPELSYNMLEGAAAAVGITLLINLKWKISAHMVGIGGFCATVFAWTYFNGGYPVWPIALSIVIAGLLATARVYMQAHDLLQILSGFFIGLLSVTLKVMF